MAINDQLQRLQTAKNDIRVALVNKGVTNASTHTMNDFVDDINSISTGTDISDTTATANDVLSSKVFYTSDGTRTTGNMTEVVPDKTVLNCGESATIDVGHTFGATITANSLASQTVADAEAKYIAEGKTAWVNGELVTGSAVIKEEFRFVCVGQYGYSYYSTDGETWTQMSGLPGSNQAYFRAVTYGNDRFVCVGDSPSSYTYYSCYSIDGETWTIRSDRPSGAFYSVAYGNDRFVYVSGKDYDKSYYSTDGETWTQMSGLPSGYATFRAVTYGNDRFVCVGDDADSGISYYSTDGETWTEMSKMPIGGYHAVTYGNDRFVCVGNNGSTGIVYSYYSTDGETWTQMSGLPSGVFRGVTYGNDRFVCVGDSGKSYYSTDGETWTAMSGLYKGSFRGVTYGNDRFVCVGDSGKSYYSTDGETWTAMSGLISSGVFYGVAYHDVCYIIIEEDNT